MSEISYDAESDALYIGLSRQSGRVHTYQSARHHDVAADVVDGILTGIEVLSASRHPIFAALIPKMQGGTLKSYRSGTASSKTGGTPE